MFIEAAVEMLDNDCSMSSANLKLKLHCKTGGKAPGVGEQADGCSRQISVINGLQSWNFRAEDDLHV